MTLVIPENFMQVAINYDYGGGNKYAVTTFGVNDFEGALSPQETLDAASGAFFASFGDATDAGVAFPPALGTVTIPGGTLGTIVGNITSVGMMAGDDRTPPAVAAVMRKNTARAGRAGRGRMFLPWILDEDNVDEAGALTSGAVTALNEVADEFRSLLAGAGLALVLLHNEGAAGGTDPSLVTSLLCETQVGTQRRRQRR